MPPAGYPAFLQYLQSGRVRKFPRQVVIGPYIETFNTLKNQGYHLEHNFGHGEQNLSVVLALLMMLAFLVDQVQQLCCPLFQAAWHKMKTKRHLWEEIRNHFRTLLFDSMAELLAAVICGIAPQKPVFENSS